MTICVIGGVYREFCVHPSWNEIFGSAGRAALAIASLGTPVVLHSYMCDEVLQVINEKAAWLDALQLAPIKVDGSVGFTYLHNMAVPEIRGVPARSHAHIGLSEAKVLRFGMVEGDAVVHADWAVYDPQNAGSAQAYGANGSTAKHLGLVLNAWEAGQMAGMPGARPSESAPALAHMHGAEAVVVKMGPEGALVWSGGRCAQVPAFRTRRVWKIGSGDCFAAHFANAWMHDGRTPVEAAEVASRATAYYCETQGFPTLSELSAQRFPAVEVSQAYRDGVRRQVYLAGPFFDLSQVWMVQQARANLRQLGLRVFSPYHDIGLGSADDVVSKDIEAIEASDLMLALVDSLDAGTIYEVGYARALGKPVVVYSERQQGESLKMMEGSGCTICADYTTALYSTLWEAVRL